MIAAHETQPALALVIAVHIAHFIYVLPVATYAQVIGGQHGIVAGFQKIEITHRAEGTIDRGIVGEIGRIG